MTPSSPAPVDIHTSPQDVPSIPPWFAELTLLVRLFTQRGILEAIAQHVHLARGRTGTYDLIDFVAILLGYALSSEPTLDAFFERLRPFARPFMALFGRDQLPHRSTLSRFLANVDSACLDALRQQFDHDLGAHGLEDDLLGGLSDHCGHRLLVFDVDATRQAARQRALVTAPEFPQPRRRLAKVSAPGYLGRKRGEVVRTRTTVLQAHTQQWLGTFPMLTPPALLLCQRACQSLRLLMMRGRSVLPARATHPISLLGDGESSPQTLAQAPPLSWSPD